MAKKTTKVTKRGRPAKAAGLMDVSMTIKLPADLRDAANEKSRTTGTPVAFVVRKALEAWVAEEKGGKK